jgi:hypothetical protein
MYRLSRVFRRGKIRGLVRDVLAELSRSFAWLYARYPPGDRRVADASGALI